jgi:hypothetical protein
MSFFEDWKARQAVAQAKKQAVIERARLAWVGCRVRALMGHPSYGEVVSIDDEGGVQIVYAFDEEERPLYYECDVTVLGVLLIHVTE